jgi:hypothetical protein
MFKDTMVGGQTETIAAAGYVIYTDGLEWPPPYAPTDYQKGKEGGRGAGMKYS